MGPNINLSDQSDELYITNTLEDPYWPLSLENFNKS